MPVFATASALPVEQLALAVQEGEGMVSELIGEKIMAPFPITWQNAAMVKLTLADSLGARAIDADKYLHAPGAVFSRLTATLSSTTLTVTPRGVEMQIPRELTLNYKNRFSALEFFSARFGKEISGLTKEKLIAAQVMNASTFTATAAGVAYTAALNSTCSYIADSIAATRRLKAKGEPPGSDGYIQVMSGPVFERIRQSATVQAYVRGALVGTTEVTKAALVSAMSEFGIKDILVGDAYYNGTADQASLSSTALTQVWGNTYIFTGKAGKTGGSGGEGMGVPLLSGIGANVFWESYGDAGVPSTEADSLSFAGGNYVEVYPDLPTDSEIIRIKMSQKPTVTNARAGDLITTSYS